MLRQRLHAQLASTRIPEKRTPVRGVGGRWGRREEKGGGGRRGDPALANLVPQPDEPLQRRLIPGAWRVVAIGVGYDPGEDPAERVVAKGQQPPAAALDWQRRGGAGRSGELRRGRRRGHPAQGLPGPPG